MIDSTPRVVIVGGGFGGFGGLAVAKALRKSDARVEPARQRLRVGVDVRAWAAALSPNRESQSLLTSRREKSASVRPALNRTNCLQLADPLLSRERQGEELG